MTPALEQWRWPLWFRRGARVVAALALVAAVMATIDDPVGGPPRAARLLGTALFAVWVWRASARRVAIDAAGLVEVRLGGRRQLPWDAIESVRMGTFHISVAGRDATIAIEPDATGDRLVAAVLALAPRLRVLGHGLGLCDGPQPLDAELPASVAADERELRIVGPGSNALVFASRHPDYARLLSCAKNRLVAAMIAAAERDPKRTAP